MACIPLPKAPRVTSPFPFSIEPPELPSASPSLTVCCKLFAFPIKVPLPLGPLVINPGVIATVNAAMDVVDAFIDSLAFECPRE